MAVSEVAICNTALIRCGTERITSLTETNRRAEFCNEEYSKARREVLASHPWNCASVRVELGQDVTTPEFEYSYRYTVPSDTLRIFTDDDPDEDSDWRREGDYILSDSSTLEILAVQDITDVTRFPPFVENAIAMNLANRICYALSQSAALAKEIKDECRRTLAEARSYDAQESSARVWKAHDWTTAVRS